MAGSSAAIVASSENVTINGGIFTLNVTPGDVSKHGAYQPKLLMRSGRSIMIAS